VTKGFIGFGLEVDMTWGDMQVTGNMMNHFWEIASQLRFLANDGGIYIAHVIAGCLNFLQGGTQ
jgi:hypothetical protein